MTSCPFVCFPVCLCVRPSWVVEHEVVSCLIEHRTVFFMDEGGEREMGGHWLSEKFV